MGTSERHLLLVDDDDDLREVLADLLRDESFRVSVARHGAEALSLLAADPLPALILLDLMMPVMDGAAFRAAQLADSRVASIPVFLITARGEPDEQARSLKAARAFRKPVPFHVLLDAINELLLGGRA